MKILIIGGVAGGASTAARLRRLDEKAEIIIFERGNHISFANCGIPYYCGDVIKEREKLELLTPQKIKALLNIEARVRSEVLKIIRDRKTITILDKTTNTEYEESYDKLVLSPGASPIKPPIEGINDERILTVRNLDDAQYIKNLINEKSVKTVALVGAGYIGLEMAENFVHQGLDVSIIELSDQILAPADPEIASYLHNHLRENGVELYLQDGVKSFSSGEKLSVNLNSGRVIEVDFAIFAIGVKPESKLAVEAGLESGKTGGILVNKLLQTSDPDIYAVGDAIEVKDHISQNPVLIPLAGPANRQGRIAADNICGIGSVYNSTQGTAILKLFDMATAMTGNSEKLLKRKNIPYLKTYIHGNSHADYYPNAFPMLIKLLFSPEDGKILGAQAVGIEGVDKRIDVIATAMRYNKTVYDLIELELCYAPPFGSAKDPVNIAGMAAENILKGKINPINWNEIESSEGYIIDVRTESEQLTGKIEGSVNIPLESLRSRLNEVPRDKKIILYCSKGLKSYFASRILLQEGYENVLSLSGGYLLYKQIIQDKNNNISRKPAASNKNINISESIRIDACGMQCPGPVMKLASVVSELESGQIAEITATDPGFKMDVASWCNSTGNELLNVVT